MLMSFIYIYILQSCLHPPTAAGPCRNDRLIRFDEPSGLWIPRPFLQPTDKRTNGNYSLLTESLWEVFKERYPGSGPEIKYTYYRHHHEKGRKQVTLSEDHKDIVVLSDEEDEGELYPPQHWIIDQRHGLEGGSDTATDEVGKSEGMFGTTGAGADSGSGLIIGSIEEEEGGRGGKQKGVYHQLNDISQTPLSARDIGIHSLDEEGEREGKTGRKGDSRQTPDEYEHMVDTTITGGDRKNILSFFGSQGEDMDFHVSKDEIISDKYSRGLGGAKEGGDESPVSIAVSTKQEKIEDRGQEKRQEWN